MHVILLIDRVRLVRFVYSYAFISTFDYTFPLSEHTALIAAFVFRVIAAVSHSISATFVTT